MGLVRTTAIGWEIIIGASFSSSRRSQPPCFDHSRHVGVWSPRNHVDRGGPGLASLAAAFPKPEDHVYLLETHSPVAGFLWGWAMFWIAHSGITGDLDGFCPLCIGHHAAQR